MKWLKRLFQKRVSCRRCGGPLYRESERAMGISHACLRAEEKHRQQQIEETQEGNNGDPIPPAINEDGPEER